MTDTYAQAMRAANEPEKRRATRARAPRRPAAAPGPATAAGGAGTARDALPAPIGVPVTPARKPRTPRAAAKKSKSSSAASPAQGPAAQVSPAARVPGPGIRVPDSPARAPGSAAEVTFTAAAAAFMAGRDAQTERHLQFEDVPAPKRLAPYATAIAATVQRDDADVAWGRLVLLYDPDGQQGWDGSFRLVAYIRAEVEPEIAADPLLGEVGWSWLSEALDAHVPGYAVPSGTVTRVITEGFGAKRDELPLTGFELRASWSPAGPGDLDTLDLSGHIAAWCDCLSAAAGLEPPGTRALRQPARG
jgi:hypothetical protein